jgi:hypothetical protein
VVTIRTINLMKTNTIATITAIVTAGFTLTCAHASSLVYSSGTYTGTQGSAQFGVGGTGGAALTLTSTSTIFTGGTYIGGAGGTGMSTTMPGTPIFINGMIFTGPETTMPGIGGKGGDALLVSGGDLTIHGGDFTAGAGGNPFGSAGYVLSLRGASQTIVDGGTFATAQTFFLDGNSMLQVEGDFGSLNNTTLSGPSPLSGSFTGTLRNGSGPASFSYSIAPGSSITFTAVPEPTTALLAALSSLCLLRRKRG